MKEPRIRDARIQDLPAITQIYNHYVTESHITFEVEPFATQDRHAWFNQFEPTGPYRLLVADDDKILGYACSTPLRPKPAYATSVETTVYLAPSAVGQGLGRMLSEALLDQLTGSEVHRAYAGVALPNEASVALHQRLGYRPLGIYDEVGNKFGKYWSVQWFEKRL